MATEPLLDPSTPRPDDTTNLRDLIRTMIGIRVDAHKLEHALGRAWPELATHGVTDVASLLHHLTFRGHALWSVVIPYLTINETYFMREADQLADFMELAVPELRRAGAARGDATLDVLSAACSTGEEPYSLAVLLADAGAPARITGVDLDPVALERARAAEYGPYSFRGLDEAWRSRHFLESAPARWTLRPQFRSGVTFERGNLLAIETVLKDRRFDAIFCRNVLIYFDRPTQHLVLHQLRRLLKPGGYLFLGHSEIFFEADLGMKIATTRRSTMYRREEPA